MKEIVISKNEEINTLKNENEELKEELEELEGKLEKVREFINN